MVKSTNDNLSIEQQYSIDDLKKLGYAIFSLPIESMEIVQSTPDSQPYEYYTLYRYLRRLRRDGEFIGGLCPIDNVTVKTRFKGIPYDFFVPVNVWFKEPEWFDKSLIERIETTSDISLCNIDYDIFEISKITDANGEKHNPQMFLEQEKESMEYAISWDQKRKELKGMLNFKEQIKWHIVEDTTLAKKIATRYNQVLKAIANGDIVDVDKYRAAVHIMYPNNDSSKTLHKKAWNNISMLKWKKKKLYREFNDDNVDTSIQMLNQNKLLFNNSYKEQWAWLYNNVLKWWEYSELYRQDIDMIAKNKEKFRKYMWALHISFGCWDMSKEVELYKQLLGIKYMDDEEMFYWLEKHNPDIEKFRKSHCFVGVDTSKTYEDHLAELELMWFGTSFNNYDKYFFDSENCFFVNEDIVKFLKNKNLPNKKKKSKPEKLIPENFNGASFDIFWNTLLNFNEKERIRLIDLFMEKLWENAVGFVGIHQKFDKEHWLKKYNTPQERTRLENLIKKEYKIEKKSEWKDNYSLDFSTDKEGNIQITMKILAEELFFTVGDKKVSKSKWTVINVGDSGKSSDEEFRKLIAKTKYATIIDVMDDEIWNSKIYVIGNKNNKIPEKWFWNFEKIFDEGYLAPVQNEKKNASKLFSYPLRDFTPFNNTFGIQEDLKKWEILMILDKEFSPVSYGNKLWVTIKIQYNRSFEKIEDLFAVIGENPDMIDITYIDFSTNISKYTTFNKNGETYTMWIDDKSRPKISKINDLSVEPELQKKMTDICKNMLLDVVKKNSL